MSATPYVLGSIALLAGIRALIRPHRAIVREGAVAQCPGAYAGACDPTLQVSTEPGEAVFSTLRGRVVAVGPTFVHVAASHEPVIVYYDGVQPTVREGQYVGRGQRLGESLGLVAFGVMEFDAGGAVFNVDPSSWLVTRGQRIAAKYTGDGTAWCEAVSERDVVVPREAGAPCDLHEPDRARFALLPVTVEVQR